MDVLTYKVHLEWLISVDLRQSISPPHCPLLRGSGVMIRVNTIKDGLIKNWRRCFVEIKVFVEVIGCDSQNRCCHSEKMYLCNFANYIVIFIMYVNTTQLTGASGIITHTSGVCCGVKVNVKGKEIGEENRTVGSCLAIQISTSNTT